MQISCIQQLERIGCVFTHQAEIVIANIHFQGADGRVLVIPNVGDDGGPAIDDLLIVVVAIYVQVRPFTIDGLHHEGILIHRLRQQMLLRVYVLDYGVFLGVGECMDFLLILHHLTDVIPFQCDVVVHKGGCFTDQTPYILTQDGPLDLNRIIAHHGDFEVNLRVAEETKLVLCEWALENEGKGQSL